MSWPKFKTLEEVPEAFRGMYEEQGGEFVAKVEDVTGLKNKNTELTRELREAREKAGTAEGKLKDAERQLEVLRSERGKDGEKLSERLRQWEKERDEAVEAAKKPLSERIASLEGRLTKLTRDEKLRAAFLEAEGRPERADRAVALTVAMWEPVDDGERLVMKDAQGNVLPTSPVEYFKSQFRKELPEFYQGSKAEGGGAAGAAGRPGASGAVGKPPTKWSSEERRQYIENNGPDAYRKLLDEEIVAAAQPKAAQPAA